MVSAVPPLSLYMHLPWCVRKCPYCDFNSFAAGIDAAYDRYLDAILADIAIEAQRAPGRELVSVFIGGGTPSLFTPAHIGRLLDAVAAHFSMAADIEITMEANPGTVECGEPSGYRIAGVNRLSIGAQSFDEQSLQLLGRIHSTDDIGRAVNDARQAGFDNINIDVMHALPGQGVDSALADIDAALALRPTHVSWYQLTLEPNTVFFSRPPRDLPSEDMVEEIQRQGRERLAQRGYEQYEVSAYARPGRRSVHNLNYWSFGDYLAVGAGAHGKITAGQDIARYVKPGHPRAYMEAMESGDFDAELRPIEGDDRVFEFMLNALRLTEGFDEALFSERTGIAPGFLGPRLERVVERGLMTEIAPGSWRPTALGRQFLNNLQAEFLPET